MNMKKRAIAFVVCLFLLVAFCIVYIFSELYTESEIPEPVITDAIKFKEEYESINGKNAGENETVRELTISENNPFVYSTADEVAEMIDNKETFVVYFGFANCPWCRSVITSLIDSAKKKDIDKIYYVDVKDIRDTYSLDKNHKPIRTVEGTEGYYKLLERLDPVLEYYNPLFYQTKKKKLKEVKVNSKRIYAPNVVIVKDGVPVGMNSGISTLQKSAYAEISKDIKDDEMDKFNCLFDLLTEEDYSCSCDGKKC